MPPGNWSWIIQGQLPGPALHSPGSPPFLGFNARHLGGPPQLPLPPSPGESPHLAGAPRVGTSGLPLGCVAGSLFPDPSLPSQDFFLAAFFPAPPFLSMVQRRAFLGLNFLRLSVLRPPGVASSPRPPPPPPTSDLRSRTSSWFNYRGTGV